MYKHLLIATDGSELATKAVRHGLSLAKALGAKVTVVTVSEPLIAVAYAEGGMVYPVDEYEKNCAAGAAKVLAAVGEIARDVGQDCKTLHVADQYPADGIIDTAKSQGCDLIVMASHGRRGLARLVLGSEANRVVTLSPVPVLICR